jgi:hypothetical protein
MPYTTDFRGYERLVMDNPEAVRILAEGDSWFAYPRRFIYFGAPSNVVQILAERNYYVIYSTASIGDEVASMMSGEQKFGFTKRLGTNGFDIILFSGAATISSASTTSIFFSGPGRAPLSGMTASTSSGWTTSLT